MKTINYDDFCLSADNLLKEGYFSTENITTEDFIEAMIVWLRDTKGGKSFFDDKRSDSITWSDLLELLQAAAIYE